MIHTAVEITRTRVLYPGVAEFHNVYGIGMLHLGTPMFKKIKLKVPPGDTRVNLCTKSEWNWH